MLVAVVLQLQFPLFKPFGDVGGTMKRIGVDLYRVFKRGAIRTPLIVVGASPAVVAELFGSLSATHCVLVDVSHQILP